MAEIVGIGAPLPVPYVDWWPVPYGAVPVGLLP